MARYGKHIKIKQHYKYDCGAACVASVAAYYGVKASLAQLRMDCGCSPDGITLQGLIDGAAKIGLNAKGYKSPDKNIADLRSVESPIIAHINDEDNYLHFIVIYKIGRENITIMDPAEGEIKKLGIDEFTNKWSGYIAVAIPGSDFCKTEGNLSQFACLTVLFFHSIKEIALSFAGSVALTIAGICISLLLQQIIDTIIPNGDAVAITATSVVLFTLMFLTLFISYNATKYLIRCSIKIDTSLIVNYLEKLFKLPLSFFSNYQAGDIASRIDDINNVRSFVTGGIINILSSIITIAGALAVMFFYNTKLTLYILLFIPLYAGLYVVSGYINKKYSKEIAKLQASFQSSLLESIGGITNIRHYGAYPLTIGKIERDYVAFATKLNNSANAVNMFETSVSGVSKLLICLIIAVGSVSVLNGDMSIGELVGFYSLCSFFTVPLNDLISISEIVSKTKISIERIYEILNLPCEEDTAGKIDLAGINGDICLNGVQFKFPGRTPLFNGISFRIKQGEITALKGESGCGKSTLAQLILRDYPVESGTITFREIDVKNFSLGQWRESIGYVPQGASLLRGSIVDNITLKEDNPDIERVLSILSKLGIIDVVKRLPGGLLTQVGERGNELSGGECQRICIARAIYKDPKIFIFDEVTSSLDAASAGYVLDCIKKLRESGKTILLISHKKEDLNIADNVVNIN